MTEQFNAEDFQETEDDQRADKKRSRRTFWCCLSTVLVPLLVVALAVGGYLWNLRDQYTKGVDYVDITGSASDGTNHAQGKGTNILLLGSDKRDPHTAEGKKVTGQRSDVMMWVHISADNKTAYVASFPRDLYVDVPGHGKDRINAALAYGGVPLTTRTVENYVGTKIDHVALVDFDGIERIVDELGGIDVRIPETFKADGVQYTKGTQKLNGKEALTFVRARHQFAAGDFQRNAHQRAVLQAMLTKIISRGTLSDPGKIMSLTKTISPYLTVDSGLTPERVAQLGMDNRSIRNSSIHYLSVPHGDPYTTKAGASVVATDDAGMAEFNRAIKEDDMDNYVSNNG